jgi:hypothetical protein
MTSLSSPKENGVGQRADLTFKHNIAAGRHGWLRLTPAYSVRVVESVLQAARKNAAVLDPFSGTATTPLCASYHGLDGTSIEINPFLTWFGNVKLASYDDVTCRRVESLGKRAASIAPKLTPVPEPPIHNIERWWPARALLSLRHLRAAIEKLTEPDSRERDLLDVAFCRVMMRRSNAAFNLQSMSFKAAPEQNQTTIFETDAVLDDFVVDAKHIAETARQNPSGPARVLPGDSRAVGAAVGRRRFDLVITSPPYPNRMSYIRELRPYMYWLRYLEEAREAGELDWKAIGGTWGVATSRLQDWTAKAGTFFPDILTEKLEMIRQAEEKNADLLARYVAKYFEDTWFHPKSLAPSMKAGAEAHYIVGNVTFYGNVVAVEEIYAAMFRELGFVDVRIDLLRKRNSNKHLYEYDVVARKA